METDKTTSTSPSGAADTSPMVGSAPTGTFQTEGTPPTPPSSKGESDAETDNNNNDNDNKNESLFIPPSPELKDYDDVIENGQAYLRAMLYIKNFDMGIVYGTGKLSDEQVERLRAKIYNGSEEDRREAIMCIKIYNAFLLYGKMVNIYRTTYQREAAKLTGLINVWEAVHNVHNALANLLDAAGIKEESEANELVSLFNEGESKGYAFSFKDDKLGFDDTELWESITRQAEVTADALSDVKAFIEPLSEYLSSEGEPLLWPILPIRLENWMDYPDAIDEQLQPDKAKYFRFKLRRRKENGEPVTPEEERLAVYPDYNEVPVNEDTANYAKEQLTECFCIWEVEKRKKKAKRGRPKKNS